MSSHNFLLVVAKLALILPLGKQRFLRFLCTLAPSLRQIPVNTRYGVIVCDAWESVCFPLIAYGEYQHWRPDEEAWARIPLCKRSLALDIGANIGVTARMIAQRAGHVHAFEPLPRALALLRLNATQNMTIHPVAVSDKVGKALIADNEAMDMAQISDRGIEVEMTTIDALGLKPDFIKIDVEGYEPEVLLGATATLANSPIVMFEALDDAAFLRSKSIILESNSMYKFERMGGGTNYIAWPTDPNRQEAG